MPLEAFLAIVGGLIFDGFRLSTLSEARDDVFERIYCKDIVIFERTEDIMDEFKGTLISPTKIVISPPKHGKHRINTIL